MTHNESTVRGTVMFSVLCLKNFHRFSEHSMFPMVCRRDRLSLKSL